MDALFRDVALHLILGGCDDTAIPVSSRSIFTDKRVFEIKSQTPPVPRVRLDVHMKDTIS